MRAPRSARKDADAEAAAAAAYAYGYAGDLPEAAADGEERRGYYYLRSRELRYGQVRGEGTRAGHLKLQEGERSCGGLLLEREDEG